MVSLRSVNKVIIVGNLTKDAELRHTNSGSPVCVFTVATNRMWTDASGQKKEDASFHRLSIWGKMGERLATVLTKGMKVYVEGELRYRETRDAQGKVQHRDADIRVNELVILSSKKDASGGENNSAASKSDSSADEAASVSGVDLDEIVDDLTEEDVATTDKLEDDLPF